MSVEIRLLGPVSVTAKHPVELGGPQQRRLLAALALAEGDPVPTEALIDSLWGETPPPSAVRSLQAQVSRLRRAFTEAGAASAAPARLAAGYVLPAAATLDVREFERHLGRARELLHRDDDAADEAFDAALGWWRGGTALADARGTMPLEVEARRLEEERLGAIEDRAELALARGAEREAIPWLRRASADHPLRQRLVLLLIAALARTGDVAGALEAYERTRALLRDQLGVAPAPELRALHHAIVNDESLSEFGPPRRAVAPPFELGRLQQRKLEYLFGAIDSDGDGFVRGEDFRAHGRRLAVLAGDDAEKRDEIQADVESWWAGLEAMGVLERASLGDWLRFWGGWIAAVTRAAEAGGGGELQRMKDSILRVFELVDRDRDGRLSADEYATWIEAWGFAFDARAHFARLDTDGDGYLSREQAVQLVKEFYLSNDPEAAGNFVYGPAF